jgi:hypothetical protein
LHKRVRKGGAVNERGTDTKLIVEDSRREP